jgi:hypothetical protein
MAVIRRIRRTPALAFGPAEWLPAHALDDTYFRVLPSGQSTVTAEEAAMLAALFAEDGELPARPAAASTWSSKSRSFEGNVAKTKVIAPYLPGFHP